MYHQKCFQCREVYWWRKIGCPATTWPDTPLFFSGKTWNFVLSYSSVGQREIISLLRFLWSERQCVKLELTSDDHLIRYAAIFWWENTKNYNLLLANWNNRETYHYYGFHVESPLMTSTLKSDLHMIGFLTGKHE